MSKNKTDQGSHTDKKNSVKGVESAETKELKKGDDVTNALIEQNKDKAEEKAKSEAAASEGAKFEAVLGEPNRTKAEFKELIDKYKKVNFVKYTLKKERLERKLATL
tara:strand:- start:263 stop:583 length:321 start_codon:yes stop_codon:yes gene_type:complete